MIAAVRAAPATLIGSGAVLAAWFLYALHDAGIKLLVANLSAWQILFASSLVVLPVSAWLRRRARPAGAMTWSVRWLLAANALIYAAGWIAYYSAARHLQLAELETVYFASPVIATILAVGLLGERVTGSRWLALGLGFVGVALASGPAGLENMTAVGLALLAAILWALSVVLIRRLSSSVSTATQMVVNNAIFLVMCAVSAPWWWRPPQEGEVALMALVGVTSLIAQYLLYEGITRVPASLAAPLEYSGLLWSFVLGYLIWNDVPDAAVFGGAGLVLVSGALIVVGELRSSRASAQPAPVSFAGAATAGLSRS